LQLVIYSAIQGESHFGEVWTPKNKKLDAATSNNNNNNNTPIA
jgi:hypothetical protein